MHLAGYTYSTFGTSEISAFVLGVSTVTGVHPSAIEVTEISSIDNINNPIPKLSGAARRLHAAAAAAAGSPPPQVAAAAPVPGVRVSYTVAGADASAFASQVSSAASSGVLASALQTAGLASLTAVGAVAVTSTTPLLSSPPPGRTPTLSPPPVVPISPAKAKKTPVGTIVGAVVGGTCGICIGVAVMALCIKKVWGYACVNEQKKESEAKQARKRKKELRKAAAEAKAALATARRSGSGSARDGYSKFKPSMVPGFPGGTTPAKPRAPMRAKSAEFLPKQNRILVQQFIDSPMMAPDGRIVFNPKSPRDPSGRSLASTAFAGGSPPDLSPAQLDGAEVSAAVASPRARLQLFPDAASEDAAFDRTEQMLQEIQRSGRAPMYDTKTGLLLADGQTAAPDRLASGAGNKLLAYAGAHLGAGAGTGSAMAGGIAGLRKEVVHKDALAGAPKDSDSEYSSGEEEDEDEDEEASIGSPAMKSGSGDRS